MGLKMTDSGLENMVDEFEEEEQPGIGQSDHRSLAIAFVLLLCLFSIEL